MDIFMGLKLHRRVQNRTHGPAAGHIPFYTAGLFLHIPQQRLRTAQVVVNTLAADAQLLSDLAEGQILVVAHIKAKVEEPMRQIALNAGLEGSVIIDGILRSGKAGYGFNFATEEYTDMAKAGILDPTKVTRSALQNASSVASMVLTTESLVTDKPDPAADAANAAAMAAAQGGGMY